MTAVSAPQAGLIAWVGLALLTIPVFMTAIDMTVLFLATPTIAAALDPSATQQLWMRHQRLGSPASDGAPEDDLGDRVSGGAAEGPAGGQDPAGAVSDEESAGRLVREGEEATR